MSADDPQARFKGALRRRVFEGNLVQCGDGTGDVKFRRMDAAWKMAPQNPEGCRVVTVSDALSDCETPMLSRIGKQQFTHPAQAGKEIGPGSQMVGDGTTEGNGLAVGRRQPCVPGVGNE